MSNRWILTIAAAIALGPIPATAQFTTFIAPPSRTADSVRVAIAEERQLVEDSIARAQIVDMRSWVDSAAGVAITARAADSAVVAALADSAGHTTFVHGARAPATATLLPLLLVLGTLSLAFGVVMMREPARSRHNAQGR